MQKFPKISVITPSFNQGGFIEETILSVIGQGYPNLEFIIIDAGSSDETVNIIKKYEEHITYWVTEPDGGQSAAINKGFARATGDIMAWLNSDDLYMPGCLHYIASQVELNINAIYFGNCIHVLEGGEKGVVTWGSNVEDALMSKVLESIDYIIQPSTFWSKNTWEVVGEVREDLHFCMDWEWFLRAKKKGVFFRPLQKPLSLYKIHPHQKTSSGGLKRQQEIYRVYTMYSERYAELYRLLMNEDVTFSKFGYRVLKRARILMNKNNDVGSFLKMFKAKKYKAFSTLEINCCAAMLF